MTATAPSAALRSATTVCELVAAQAELTPGAVAVTSDSQQVSYADLVSTTYCWAHHLVARGVRPGDVVGLLIDRSPAFVTAALAVLAAGGAYLPLDRRRPEERLRWMVADSGATLVLTDRAVTAAGWATAGPVEDVRSLPTADEHGSSAPAVPVHTEQLAYVMYTSGSTGRPKAIANTHRNVVDFVRDRCWDPGKHARVLAYSPPDFDSSTYELWVPLSRGGQAVVWPVNRFDVGELRTMIARHDITACYLTTALFDVVAHEDVSALAPLREIVTGGDVLPEVALRLVLRYCPNTTVLHAYGPTETTVFCSLQALTPGRDQATSLNLGEPMDHTAMYVLDAELRPSAPGTVGELFVAGTHLARGYLDQPGLTAQRFLPDPYGGHGSRMYRTGDLARRAENGTITFAGRVDRQLKLRGFRVEPGEVEAALSADDAVRQAVVVARDDLPGGRGLIGYVVADRNSEVVLDIEALRRRTASVLPDYLAPTALVQLDELPLTGNGKVDLAALPPWQSADTSLEPASTPLEGVLRRLFADVLQCPPVGVAQNFFQLGGHSLAAIRLCGRITAETGRTVTIRDVFEHPTVARLARHLEAEPDPDERG